MTTPRPHVVHLVCTANFAGVERYISYLAPAQVARGFAVTVIGGEPGLMTTALRGTGVAHFPSGGFVRDMRALTASLRPSLVHAHMTDAEVLSVLGKVRHHAPVVSTLHFAKPRGRDRLRRALFGPLPRWLDAQIAISNHVAATACEPDAIVIPNGVPWDQPPAPRADVVLVAQRLELEKDTSTAIRAWADSRLEARGWRMVVAGEGSQRAELDQLARRLGVADSVDRVGTVSDVAERMSRAGLFLATAPAEPFGLAVVEAMAAGTPVVAAAGGAHLETVGRVGENNLFPPGDATAAATILRRLADSLAEREAIAAAQRREYLACFTIEHHADQVLAVYRNVLGRSRGAPARL